LLLILAGGWHNRATWRQLVPSGSMFFYTTTDVLLKLGGANDFVVGPYAAKIAAVAGLLWPPRNLHREFAGYMPGISNQIFNKNKRD